MSAYTISQPLLCAALRLVPISACVCESMCVWQLAAAGSARLWPSLLTCSGSRGSRKSRVSVWATRQLVTQLLYCDCRVYSWSLMANEQVVDAWDKSLYWQFLKKTLNFERKVTSSNLKWSKKVDFMYTHKFVIFHIFFDKRGQGHTKRLCLMFGFVMIPTNIATTALLLFLFLFPLTRLVALSAGMLEKSISALRSLFKPDDWLWEPCGQI